MTIGHIAPGVMKVWTDGWPPFTQGQVIDVDQLRRMAGLVTPIKVPSVLPDGFRLWTPEDGVAPIPVLDPKARYGLVGRYLELLEDQTEAGLAPVGAMVLAQLGTLIGRRATVSIGEHRHHANLFELVVGRDVHGREGLGRRCRRVARGAGRAFFLRSPRPRRVRFRRGADRSVRDTEPDEEAKEKRRVIHEREFSAVLRVARRESTILSEIIRQGFDYKPITHTHPGRRRPGVDRAPPRGDRLDHPGRAGGLLDRSSTSRTAGSTASCSCTREIERILPFGGEVDQAEVEAIAGHVGQALRAPRLEPLMGVRYRIKPTTELGELWEPWYRGRCVSAAGRGGCRHSPVASTCRALGWR